MVIISTRLASLGDDDLNGAPGSSIFGRAGGAFEECFWQVAHFVLEGEVESLIVYNSFSTQEETRIKVIQVTSCS